MIGTNGEREREKTMLAAPDDDDDVYMVWFSFMAYQP